ncbi:MAG: hypothetical protein HKN88_09025 [Gammaproteobacteria bacterium]|nr:hypothetical protein [Gammaproteobacteria bacterium]NNC98197.1 hypothetical protein [Gammaproteobacteria bacterium]NNM14855.1 hypothetical protein [Gammaproteobacteria bacterium]
MKLYNELLERNLEFTHPLDVLAVDALSREQKIQILREWEYDAREKEAAADEGMPSGDDTHLDEIHKALLLLDAAIDIEHTPPTRQG